MLRDQSMGATNARLLEGLKRMKASGADVILIDPQFAPMVVAKKETDAMVHLLATTAKAQNVDLFQRFRGDAPLAACRAAAVRGLHLAGRSAHERLELWLRRQASGRGHRRSGHPDHPDRHQALKRPSGAEYGVKWWDNCAPCGNVLPAAWAVL